MSFTFTRYNSAAHMSLWNDFVRSAKNGHFMFERAYMDYHADRFKDHSVLAFEDGHLISILPANIKDDTLYSHQGLSFGGLLYGNIRAGRAVDMAQELVLWLKEQGIKNLYYKFIPPIYHQTPAEEDSYALSFLTPLSHRIDISTTINQAQRGKVSDTRKEGAKKAIKHGLRMVESVDWKSFWDVLSKRLGDKYEAKPVHTLDEIKSLHASFPNNIRLFTIQNGSGQIMAGTVVYETPTVAHTQYIAGTDEGLKLGALDLLFSELIGTIFSYKRYFDFGTSTEDNGKNLNKPLITFKEGFGGGAVIFRAALFEL